MTQDGSRRVLPGNLYAEGGTLAEVGGPERSADRVLDAEDCLVLPGLINGYTTGAYALLSPPRDESSGRAADRREALEDRLTRRDVQMAAAWAAAEMLETGTTTFLDLYPWEEEIARAVVQTGGRGFLAWRVGASDDLMACERFLARVQEWDRVTPLVGLAGGGPLELMQEATALARRRGTKRCLPIAESRREVYRFQKAHGDRPVTWLDSEGLLDQDLLVIHAVWVTLNEVRALARGNTAVIHCPVSNQWTGAGGPMPLPEMEAEGVPLALGTDAPDRGGTLDLFHHMRACALLHRGSRGDPRILPSHRLLDLATVEGAQALGFPGGRLEAGAPADFIVLETGRKLPPVPPAELISYVTYQATGAQVRDVVVDGQPVVEDGRLQTLDLESLRAELQAVQRELGHENSGN